MHENNNRLSPEAQAVLRTLNRLGPGFGLEVTDGTEALADELIRQGLAERVGEFVRLCDGEEPDMSGPAAADEYGEHE